jgi:hypothetical protein
VRDGGAGGFGCCARAAAPTCGVVVGTAAGALRSLVGDSTGSDAGATVRGERAEGVSVGVDSVPTRSIGAAGTTSGEAGSVLGLGAAATGAAWAGRASTVGMSVVRWLCAT